MSDENEFYLENLQFKNTCCLNVRKRPTRGTEFSFKGQFYRLKGQIFMYNVQVSFDSIVLDFLHRNTG